MEDNKSTVIVLLFWVILFFCYVINFVQLIYAIFEGNINQILIKAIGAFTALGSIITVWF